jgi:hypothetical protein
VDTFEQLAHLDGLVQAGLPNFSPPAGCCIFAFLESVPVTWPYFYVRDQSPPAPTHHRDYRTSRDDRALCGQPLVEPVYGDSARPDQLCPACEQLVPDWLSELWVEWALERDRETCEMYEKRIDQLEHELTKAENKLAGIEREKHEKRAARSRKPRRITVVQGGLPETGNRR